MAFLPERRITAMAPTPCGVAKAMMVSSRSASEKLIVWGGMPFQSAR